MHQLPHVLEGRDEAVEAGADVALFERLERARKESAGGAVDLRVGPGGAEARLAALAEVVAGLMLARCTQAR